MLTDAGGVVLKVEVTPANTPDQAMLLPMLDRLPKLATAQRPMALQGIIGDRAYGTKAGIAGVENLGLESFLAERTDDTHGSGLGELRYVVEQTLSHFGYFRRIKLCYERTRQSFQAFHDLASALLVINRLRAFIPQF